MDDVRVYRGSPKPERIGALAYARGREIHLAPGEDRHLPHEAWHLVQQAQRRVRATLREGGVPIGDDPAHEREADVMGAKALALNAAGPTAAVAPAPPPAFADPPAQRAPRTRSQAKAQPVPKSRAPQPKAKRARAKKATTKKLVNAVAAQQGWFRKARQPTAYGQTNVGGKKTDQGPHTIPHVLKEVIGERSVSNNANFDPSKIPTRSAVIPSQGQARKLLRRYEESSGVSVPLHQKIALDKKYAKALEKRRNATTFKEHSEAASAAAELNPLSSYAHGTKASHANMAGKGERKTTVQGDADEMEGMTKGGPIPTFDKLDLGDGLTGRVLEHIHTMARQYGQLSRGDEALSDLDTSSDEEYAAPKPVKKKVYRKRGRK